MAYLIYKISACVSFALSIILLAVIIAIDVKKNNGKFRPRNISFILFILAFLYCYIFTIFGYL